jgi:hypothetical protein
MRTTQAALVVARVKARVRDGDARVASKVTTLVVVAAAKVAAPKVVATATSRRLPRPCYRDRHASCG